ncbi:MAG: disulfide oxidoreductase [Magnetospirillum sp. WYHS-4]
MQIDTSRERARITAVLGPTNTGKTHFAMERMLGHASGMIGFPLRLLARENYERAVKIKGSGQVALITGEEKIVPAHPRYFLCTVEAMPADRPVAFLAVDEVQMCADPDRGHVFTERLLHARGLQETMFMGAETVRPLLRRLVPDAEFVVRPRLSTLSYAGQRKLTRLPARSAVVAFSTTDVYTIAELVRRQRGGTAVVLGALSPRTRNAQVAMYQAGEVDYLVATDAIGMGLNMDVDHVAFAATRKFDGRLARDLTPSELAQIAGRAGRHMNDGTFGTTAEIGPLAPEVVERIEGHAFEPLRYLFWRNPRLRFGSIEALQKSLTQPPPAQGLVRAREADDELALKILLRDEAVRRAAAAPDRVRLLWDVARIPDFGKVQPEAHARLLARIFGFLAGAEARLPTDWVAAQVARIDRTDGDIETLMQRIAHIRTWTYVSHRADWMKDAGHWQGVTRQMEDRLSDALHERLTQRFVDRRTAVLVSRLKENKKLLAAVDAEGWVLVEGLPVGRMDGFRFHPEGPDAGTAARAVSAATRKALASETARRIHLLESDGDEAFALQTDRSLAWRGATVGRLVPGGTDLKPQVDVPAFDLLAGDDRERIRRRLAAFVEAQVRRRLAPLAALESADLSGPARGIAFHLMESLGSFPRGRVEDQVAGLAKADRKALAALGVRIGRESVFLPALLKPDALALRALLWSVAAGQGPFHPPPAGRTAVPKPPGLPQAFLEAVGFRVLGPLALRLDILERLGDALWVLKPPFSPPADLANLLGCGAAELEGVLRALGFKAKPNAAGKALFIPPRGRKAARIVRDKPDSPFAMLRTLVRPERATF